MSDTNKDAVTREQVIEWGRLAGFESSLTREYNLERLADFAIFARQDRVKAEALSDARDAARYRWLRDFNVRSKDGVDINPPCEHVHASIYSHAVGTIPAVRLAYGDELDRAIDAAMTAANPENLV